ERELGGLDILVNNAGIALGADEDREALRRKFETRIMETVSGQGIQTHLDVTENLSDEAWRRMIAVHLDGTFFCTREALRLMSRQNRGAIINLSSVAALAGLESVPHYSAAKGGILGFTRAVAREVASRGIRVNAICPGYIDTPMTQPMSPLMPAAARARTPLGRSGEPREVAATALFLGSGGGPFFIGHSRSTISICSTSSGSTACTSGAPRSAAGSAPSWRRWCRTGSSRSSSSTRSASRWTAGSTPSSSGWTCPRWWRPSSTTRWRRWHWRHPTSRSRRWRSSTARAPPWRA